MPIKDDLDFMFIRHKEKSKMEKSRVAMRILRWCDQVKECIGASEQDLEDLTLYPWIPPTVRGIVKEYTSAEISSDVAQRRLTNVKTKARAYFIEKGYSPALAEKEHKKYLADHRRMLNQERDLLKKVEGLLEKRAAVRFKYQ